MTENTGMTRIDGICIRTEVFKVGSENQIVIDPGVFLKIELLTFLKSNTVPIKDSLPDILVFLTSKYFLSYQMAKCGIAKVIPKRSLS